MCGGYTVKDGKASKIDSFAISKAADGANTDDNNGDANTDGSIPKTSGQQIASVLVLAVPVAATVFITAGALKRKRDEEV